MAQMGDVHSLDIPPRFWMIVALAIILMAAWYPYRHASENDFAYDDVVIIQENPRVQGLGQIGAIFTTLPDGSVSVTDGATAAASPVFATWTVTVVFAEPPTATASCVNVHAIAGGVTTDVEVVDSAATAKGSVEYEDVKELAARQTL